MPTSTSHQGSVWLMPPALKRLWLAGAALLVLLLTLVAGNFVLPQEKRLTGAMVGHDFLAFHTAGTFVREGRIHDLYDLEKVKRFQHELAQREHLEIGDSFGPFWNPPFYAWVFVPAAAMPYRQALLCWEGINLLALVGAIGLMIRMLRGGGGGLAAANVTWRHWGLIPVLLLICMPLIQALTHGQNTLISLFLLCLVMTFWQRECALWAGLAAGLLLYKPQLGLVVAMAVILTMGRRAAVGVIVTAGLFLLATLLTLPGAISDYAAKMPGNLHRFQVEQVYLWDRHVTLRAFWRLLLQGRAAGEMSAPAKACWIVSWSALAGALAWSAWRLRHGDKGAQRKLMTAVIVAMPLLMPFYFDYDLLLISVSAVFLAGDRLAAPIGSTQHFKSGRWLTIAWVGLFLWLMVNSSVARATGVNGTVVLLAAMAGLLIHRTGRSAAAGFDDHPNAFSMIPSGRLNSRARFVKSGWPIASALGARFDPAEDSNRAPTSKEAGHPIRAYSRTVI